MATGLEINIVGNLVKGIGGTRDPADPSTWPITSNAIHIESAGTAEVRGNHVTGAWHAYFISENVGSVTGMNNVAAGIHTGLLAFEVDGPVTFNSSDFTDYHVPLHVDDVTDFDATCNWWGSSSGPSNPEVNDPGVYTPWAEASVAGMSTTTCSGGE